MHPALFQEGGDGYPIVLIPEPTDDQRTDADDAIELCPVSAISWENGNR